MKRSNETTTIKPYVSKRRKQPISADVPPSNDLHRESNGGSSTGGGVSPREEQHPTSPLSPANMTNTTNNRKWFRSRIPSSEIDRCKGHQRPITSVYWHPVRENLLISSSLDKSIHLWTYKGKKLSIERSIDIHHEGVKDVRWSGDGRTILSASFDKSTKLIDCETGTCKRSFNHKDLVTTAIFHDSNEQLFLTGTFSTGIYSWDIRQPKETAHYKSFFGQVQDLLFLPDNETFLSSAESAKRNSLDKTIVAWDFKTRAVMSNQIYQEPFTCTCLRLHPSHKSFLAQSAAGYIVLFNSEKPWKMNKYKRFQGHTSGGYHVGFDVTPDGLSLYSGDTSGCFFVYNYQTSTVSKKEKLFTSPCVTVACSPFSPSTTCFASWDGTLALWE